jgi:hypothetical protein
MLGRRPLGSAPLAGKLAAGGTPGNASGSTVSETLSLIAGAAAGDGAASGATLSETLALIAGSATGAANASGTTISETLSLISGAATGAANASGATLSETLSLVPGAATGAAAASGATVAETISLIAGSAVVNQDGNAPGATVSVAYSFIPGTATGAANVSGATISVAYSLVPGAAAALAVSLEEPGQFGGPRPWEAARLAKLQRRAARARKGLAPKPTPAREIPAVVVQARRPLYQAVIAKPAPLIQATVSPADDRIIPAFISAAATLISAEIVSASYPPLLIDAIALLQQDVAMLRSEVMRVSREQRDLEDILALMMARDAA